MKCKICLEQSNEAFRGLILGKYDIGYFLCPNCGFLQTENPYWLDEAYAIPINSSDTGVLQRNLVLTRITAMMILCLLNKNGVFLDYAGGYGIFVRLMRDMGFDFFWQDMYAENLVAKGFEFTDRCSTNKIELLTSMETFEHFVDPLKELRKMTEVSDTIIFSTTLLPNPIPTPNNWWYYGLEHGQHISLYQYKTLKLIANTLGMHLCSNHQNLHLLSTRKVSETLFRALIPVGAVFGSVLSRLYLASKTGSDMLLATKQSSDQAKL